MSLREPFKIYINNFFRTKLGNLIFFQLIRFLFNEKSDVPLLVRIESSNLCNGRCVFCPHLKQTRKKGVMSMHAYEKIIKECAKIGVKEVHLQNFGEPLFDKNIFLKIKMANSLNLKTVIFTNASLFDNKKIREMIKSNLDEVWISFEGYNKNIFEELRPGLKYAVVSRNINKIYEVKKELNSLKPKVILNVVFDNELSKYKDEFRKKWSERVDFVNFQRIHNWTASEIKIPFSPICNVFWNYTTITWDGKILSCCLDWDGKYVIDDLKKHSINEIWNNSKYKKLRKLMLSGKSREIPLCKSCSTLYDPCIYTDMLKFYVNWRRSRNSLKGTCG